MLLAVGTFAAIRLVVLFTAPLLVEPRCQSGPGRWDPPHALLRWDSGYYYHIVRHGYPDAAQPPAVAAFLPLYPMLAWLLARLMPAWAAMLTVSNAAAIAGSIFMYLWAEKLTGAKTALLAVLLAAVYPPAMFFSAAYTEGLFFLEVALALWLMGKGRLWLAAGVTAVACATRPTGLALAGVVVFWYLFCASRGGWSRRAPWTMALLVLCTGGFLAYCGYLWGKYDRPDAYVAAQKHWKPAEPNRDPLLRALTMDVLWNRASRPFRWGFRGKPERLLLPEAWEGLLAAVMLALTVAGLIRPGPVPRVTFLLPLLIFLMAYLPDPAGGARLGSLARYQTAALPCFLLHALWLQRNRVMRLWAWGIIPAQAFMLPLYTQAFVNWMWAG